MLLIQLSIIGLVALVAFSAGYLFGEQAGIKDTERRWEEAVNKYEEHQKVEEHQKNEEKKEPERDVTKEWIEDHMWLLTADADQKKAFFDAGRKYRGFK